MGRFIANLLLERQTRTLFYIFFIHLVAQSLTMFIPFAYKLYQDAHILPQVCFNIAIFWALYARRECFPVLMATTIELVRFSQLIFKIVEDLLNEVYRQVLMAESPRKYWAIQA